MSRTIWQKHIGVVGGASADVIEVDPSGIYIGGTFWGTLDGQSSNAGSLDAYLAKFSLDGTKLWVNTFGTAGEERIDAISISADGSIYAGGRTGGNLDGLTNQGVWDAYITKFNSSGVRDTSFTVFVGDGYWTAPDYVTAMATDEQGSVYSAGYWAGSAISPESHFGGGDGFVAKHSSSGEPLWRRSIGSSATDFAKGMAVDGSSIYVVGGSNISSDTGGYVGRTPGDFSLKGRWGLNGFLAKLDLDGQTLWERGIFEDNPFNQGNGYKATTEATGVTIGRDGEIYVVGYTAENLHGNLNLGGRVSGTDAFVSRYEADGSWVWTELISSAGDDFARSVSVGNDGSVYVVGDFREGTLEGQDTYSGNYNAFISKLTPTGALQWSHRVIGETKSWELYSGEEYGQDVDVYGGVAYVAGNAYRNVDPATYQSYNDGFFAQVSLRPAGQKINGSDGPDTLIGTLGDDTITGLDGKDLLIGLGGDDYLYGSGGIDTAKFNYQRSDYTITAKPSSSSEFTVVTDKLGVEGTDYLQGVERLQFADMNVALDINGVAAQAYRIYKAAFNRVPDPEGLGFWISKLDSGSALLDAALGFIGSDEFKRLFAGGTTDERFIELMYSNVLGRIPDADGYIYWKSVIEQISKGELLKYFSESPENVRNVQDLIAEGIEYIPYQSEYSPAAAWRQTVDYFDDSADKGIQNGQEINYRLDVNYDLAFDGNNFHVFSRIDLVGDPAPADIVTQWEQGINSLWNNQFALVSADQAFPVLFDVKFVEDGGGEHHDITVIAGAGRSNANTWYVEEEGWGPDYHEEKAAHEYGHLIGVFDEYANGATKDGYVTKNTLMSDLSTELNPWYLDGLAEQVALYTGVDMQAVLISTLPEFIA